MDAADMALAVMRGDTMMKLVTFNIRCDYDQDGANSFCYRKALILEKIGKEQPDIICFQEVLPHVAVWLKTELQEYYVVGCGRNESLEDEQMAVAYRKERLNLISMDTFWLSPTPYVAASRYQEQSICPRVCTEAVFEDMKEKKIFRLVNLHLDHMGAQARVLGLRQILDKVDAALLFPDAPVILAGDFNGEPGSEELRVMEEYPQYKNYTEGMGITYHGFEADDEPETIDYIFVKGELDCVQREKWEDCRQGVWLSDHYPICVLLKWEA